MPIVRGPAIIKWQNQHNPGTQPTNYTLLSKTYSGDIFWTCHSYGTSWLVSFLSKIKFSSIFIFKFRVISSYVDTTNCIVAIVDIHSKTFVNCSSSLSHILPIVILFQWLWIYWFFKRTLAKSSPTPAFVNRTNIKK